MRDKANERRGWLTWLLLAGAAAAGASAIVALVLLLADASRDRDAALRLQERSSNRIILAATFEAAMARSEATLGRFVISGDRSLGQIYSDDWRSSGFLLDRLEDASRTEKYHSGRMAAIRSAWTARTGELADTALRTTYGQNNEALATYYRIRMSPALKTLSREIHLLINRERAVLAQRNARVGAAVQRANTLTTLVSIFGVILVVGVGTLAFAVLRAAERRRLEEDRNADLEDAVAARTSELRAANARLVDEMATREAAEARLRQAHKMDAVGQLTGGIAHDFNNMLAVVLGGVELAKRRLIDGKGDPMRYLDSASEGATRAAELTKRLLAFARAEPLLPKPTDTDALIEGMSDLLDRTLGERIEVRYIAHSEGWPVFVDRSQLENALLNLAVNARDAMIEGGTLTIATAPVTLKEGAIPELAAGNYVRISVSDTGTGMSRDVMDRIFEPFFTTKNPGEGTGLGLSQVFGYIRQSSGTVTVDSQLGVGTTVSLYLPRYAGAALREEAPSSEAVQTTTMGRHLMVIEDDVRVLAATCDALAEIGHTALGCSDEASARAALKANPDIDLVVSDVLMPGLTGPELVAQLRQQRPGMRALFVTGYTGEAANAASFGDDHVLRKPFTIAALQAAVDRALDLPPPPVLETREAA